MSDIEKLDEDADAGMQTRRKLLTSAGRVAVTAPAVALLLSASALPAAASGYLDGSLPETGEQDGAIPSSPIDDIGNDDNNPGVPSLDD